MGGGGGGGGRGAWSPISCKLYSSSSIAVEIFWHRSLPPPHFLVQSEALYYVHLFMFGSFSRLSAPKRGVRRADGHFTSSKNVRDFVRAERYLRTLMELLSEIKGFLPKVYEIIWE